MLQTHGHMHAIAVIVVGVCVGISFDVLVIFRNEVRVLAVVEKVVGVSILGGVVITAEMNVREVYNG